MDTLYISSFVFVQSVMLIVFFANNYLYKGIVFGDTVSMSVELWSRVVELWYDKQRTTED